MIIQIKTFSMFLFIFKKRGKVFSRLLYLKHDSCRFLLLCLLPLLLSIEKNGQRQAPTQCMLSCSKHLLLCLPWEVFSALKDTLPFYTWTDPKPVFLPRFTSFYWTSTISLLDIGTVKVNKYYFWWESPYSFTDLHIVIKMRLLSSFMYARR